MSLLSLILIVSGLVTTLPSHAQQHGKLLQTFSLKEAFGVSHPRQILDFDFAQRVDPRAAYLTGPEGLEVPYQLLRNGKIAIQTDLPANAERTWRLYAGKAPVPVKSGVQVTKGERYYEITNELTGVRIPVPRNDLKYTPAPVQGIRGRDREWTGTGPNYLSPAAKKMNVRFLENGPLKVVIQVSYTYDRPEYVHKERGAPPGGIRYPAGEGFYRSTIEVQAGQPSILFGEETDMDVSYSLNIYDGLHPNRARYRGHHSDSKEAGYEADGQQYRMSHMRPPMDAFVDLTYAAQKTYRPMAVWDPWIFDSGWYWQIYNSEAPPDSNVLGIFAGRASRALGAANSGVHIFTAPAGKIKSIPTAGFQIICNQRSPDGRYPRVRFSWGLFTGVKGEHLKDPYQIQPIAMQMNLHAGINLNKIHRYELDFPEPERGYGALYMNGAVVWRTIQKLRQDKTGPHGKGYYGYLYNADPTVRPLIDMWADRSGKKTKEAVSSITDTAKNLLNALVNGDGIYDFQFHYWHGGLEMMRKGVWIDAVLADGRISPAEKVSIKAAAALFANILWDDDFVPLFAGHGLNLGTENMPIQQQGYRSFYALLLSDHPQMRGRAKAVEKQTIETLHRIVNESGAQIGSPHYVGASFAPTLNSLLQLRMLRKSDPFEKEARLAEFAEFYLNLLSPPEVRFGGKRKLVSLGDGSSESSELYGQLATGFATANPQLSARLMGAWRSMGKPHSGFFGSTVFSIDEEALFRDPALGNASFPGYYSVLRYGWGSKNETALWFINGDFYRDHRHHDHGSLVLYALGAPISIDWGSMYSPQVPGGFMHSLVLPTSSIRHAWDQDNPPLNGGMPWKKSKQEAFVSFNTSGYVRGSFSSENGTVWTRSILSLHPNENNPIVVLRDEFGGPDATKKKIFSLNLMAEGTVDTPAGTISPVVRNYQRNNELPSAGKVFPLAAGLNRLGFTGQWGIDWDLYTISKEPLDALIGNWAHGWHPNQEQDEFMRSNGRPFEERQHILRIKGNGPFQVIMLPYRKGQKRDEVQVKQDGSKVTITAKDESTIIAGNFYAYKNSQKRVLATFDDGLVEAHEIGTKGGPVEISVEPLRANITAHGKKGMREIRLPGRWTIKHGQNVNLAFISKTGKWILDYQAEHPLTVSLETTSEH
jgi:hypothetical protein